MNDEPLGAIDDASEALQLLVEPRMCEKSASERLRIKALYRRGLAREVLGELSAAFEDLSLALRLAPGNVGIVQNV